MTGPENKHIGTKVLYSIVIGMSGLILFLCAIGILGVWLVQGTLSDATVALLEVVEGSARVTREATGRVDQTLSGLQAQVIEVAEASSQLSQNITDKGLVLVLLPAEKEEQLTEKAGSVRDTYQGVRETLATGLGLYRSINRLPFVSRPGSSADQMDRIETSVTRVQTLVKTLRSEITDYRTGVSGTIDKVTGAASLLNSEIHQIRDELAQLQARLAALEASSIRLQQVIPGLFITVAVIFTLVLGFLIFTQVEVVRLYVKRWRNLGELQSVPMVDLPAQTP